MGRGGFGSIRKALYTSKHAHSQVSSSQEILEDDVDDLAYVEGGQRLQPLHVAPRMSVNY